MTTLILTDEAKLGLALERAAVIYESSEFQRRMAKEFPADLIKPYFPPFNLNSAPLPWWKPLSKEIAVTSGSNVTIRTHWLQKATIPQLVNTLVHESLHVQGFKHARFWPVDWNDFIYTAGKIAEEMSG